MLGLTSSIIYIDYIDDRGEIIKMASALSEGQLLQRMMTQYCRSSVYPDMKKLRDLLTQLSDEQKLDILRQKYLWTPLHWAAVSDDPEIISTLLQCLPTTYRLQLLMVDKISTPLHHAAHWDRPESVKVILDCLTADNQIELMSVQWGDETAIQNAEYHGNADVVRILREYWQQAKKQLKGEEPRQKEGEQQRQQNEDGKRQRLEEQKKISEEKTRQKLSGKAR